MNRSGLAGSSMVHILLLLAVGAGILLPELGQLCEWNGQEVRHAEIAREMYRSGHYVAPMRFGEIYTFKTPLYNWVMAAAFATFHRVDFLAARLPSAGSAIAIAIAIYLLGRRWMNARAGLWAGMVWLTFPLVVLWGRSALMDVPMACLVTWAIVLGVYSLSAPTRGARWGLWSAACFLAGLGMLTKGAHALFFFFVTMLIVWRVEKGTWRIPLWAVGGGFLLALTAPALWAAAVELSEPGYLSAMMQYISETGLTKHSKRFYYYFDQLFLRTLPWALFAPALCYLVARRMRARERTSMLIPAVALLTTMLIMSMVVSKQAHYLLPVLPLWALLLAETLSRATEAPSTPDSESRERRVLKWLVTWPIRVLLLVVACGGAACAITWPRIAPHGQGVAWASCAAMACVALWGGWRSCKGRCVDATAAFILVAALGMSTFWHLHQSGRPPSPNVANIRQMEEKIPPGAMVVDYHMESELASFLMDRPLNYAKSETDLVKALSQPGEFYIVTRDERGPHLPGAAQVMRIAPRPVERLGSWPVDRATVVLLRERP